MSTWLSRLGIGLLAYFAADGGGGGSGAVPLLTDPRIGQGCCRLATDIECPYSGSKSNFNCNTTGGTKAYWMCVNGAEKKGCGECAANASCVSGSYKCSIWWDVTS